MSKKPTDKKLIEFAEFVATKFADNHKPWVYTRDLGELDYVRYKFDYTGNNVWYRRVLAGFRFAWEYNVRAKKGSLSYQLRDTRKRSLWDRARGFVVYFGIQLRKEKHLPDGVINGIYTNWEEDGEYIAMMQPIVGQKVIEFLKAEPENEHAKAILAAMHEAYSASWGKKEDDKNE